MSKHTPGPWIAGDDEDSDLFLVGPETYPGLVTRPVVKLHNEADARLIAAAPELLEALEAIIERWDTPLWKDVPHTGNYINAARLVVAKAKGE